MEMKIENVFRKIPEFSNIVLDTILFESKYPVMFTCKIKEICICLFAVL